jgi:hypothetical protein
MPAAWNRSGTLSEKAALDMTPDEARREVLRLRMRVVILEREKRINSPSCQRI